MESDSTENGIRIGGPHKLAEVEKAHVLATCERCRWQMRHVCRCLGLGTTTVYRWLDAWGVDVAAKRRAAR